MALARNKIDLRSFNAAAKQAKNYLATDETGIMVANMESTAETPSTATTKNVFIDDESVNIRDGQNVLSKMSADGILIGASGDSKISISNVSIAGLLGDNRETFSIYPSEASTSNIEIVEKSDEIPINDTSFTKTYNFVNTPVVGTTMNIQAIITMENNGVSCSYQVMDKSFTVVSGMSIWISDQFAFTQPSGGAIGAFSLSGSSDGSYTGSYVTLEAETDTTGAIIRSVTFIANMITSSAIECAYTFGTRSGLRSEFAPSSFASGTGLIAKDSNQVAFGIYNKYSSGYDLMFGNGTGDSSRSNLFAFKDTGELLTDIDTSGDLYTAIDNLGWTSEVIE